jgi:hypothetical protein
LCFISVFTSIHLFRGSRAALHFCSLFPPSFERGGRVPRTLPR